MLHARLEPVPEVGRSLNVRVPKVGFSADALDFRLSADSRTEVELELSNRTDHELVVDLSRARLHVEDTGLAGEAEPVANGEGDLPSRLFDGSLAPAVHIAPGESKRVWIGFGPFANAGAIETPPRLILELPEATEGRSLMPALYEPGSGQPRWYGERPAGALSTGFGAQAGLDEGSVSFFRQRFTFDARLIVVGAGYGVGFRMPQHRSSQGQKIVCCDFGVEADVALPLLEGRLGWIGPFAGVQWLEYGGDDRIEKKAWFGPELGVRFMLAPVKRSYAPFPVRQPASLLGRAGISVAYVRWFGRDWPDSGESGVSLLVDYTTVVF